MSVFFTITWFPAFQIIKTAHQCFSTSMWCSNELFLTINVISALHGDAYHHHGQYTYMHELPNRDLIRHEALKLRFSFTFWLSHLPPKFPQLKRECVWLKPTVMITVTNEKSLCLMNLRLRIAWDLGDWKTGPTHFEWAWKEWWFAETNYTNLLWISQLFK